MSAKASYGLNAGMVMVLAKLLRTLRAEAVREVKNRLTQTDQFTSILNADELLSLTAGLPSPRAEQRRGIRVGVAFDVLNVTP